MRKEKIKEAKQKDKKQLLFKPTTGVIIFFLIAMFIPAWNIIYQFIQGTIDFGFTIILLIFIVFFLYMWYMTPVFIFAEDSVHIQSFLFYVFGIDGKTTIKYADIISVEPDEKFKYTEFRRFRMALSVRGITRMYVLVLFNTDIIAKIYLRFKEKLGDRVIAE